MFRFAFEVWFEITTKMKNTDENDASDSATAFDFTVVKTNQKKKN